MKSPFRLCPLFLVVFVLLSAEIAAAQELIVAPPDDAVAVEEIVLRPGVSASVAGAWAVVRDVTAAGGARLEMPERGQPKITSAQAAPTDYFEIAFDAVAGVPYRLWLRGRATQDSYTSDSVYVQFSGTVTSSGAPVFRLDTMDAAVISIEDCKGCGVAGWGWNDSAYGAVPPPPIFFAATGQQRLRIQNREDGIAIDQIVLSPALYVAKAPGANRNDATILDPLTGAPAVPPAGPSPTTLRVMQWNVHHGVGTDGKYNINRIATWIASLNPDVVSLNEVEKRTGWGNEDQPARYQALLQAKTGVTWYAVWAQEYGRWDANGKGNLLLSRYPWIATARYVLSKSRTVALGQILVNGRTVTVSTTHLDPDSSTTRIDQAQEVLAWENSFADARIIVGDMNAQSSSAEMTLMKQTYADAWAAARAKRTAYSAPDNPSGATRNSRIDYIFTSKTASALSLTRVDVVDTRDANGIMPSDHRPLVAEYGVN